MRSLIFVYTVIILTFGNPLSADASEGTREDSRENSRESRAQVLMIGVFHFDNPGLDKVKIKHMDVTDGISQAYLANLSQRIADRFKPTLVLLEYHPEDDDVFQRRYQQYLNGDYELGRNEIYQMGFRIAKDAGNVKIASFDEREIGWNSEDLFKVMPEEAPDVQAKFDALIEAITQESQQDQLKKSLQELLIKHNQPAGEALNKSIYIATNSVSKNGNFEGAKAASSWWHRNFRMYAKIQQAATAGQRIVVIGGQGHTAILKDFMALDTNIEAVSVESYLK